MIIGIHGELGSGKTAIETFLGLIFFNAGYAIKANYHLKPPFEYELMDFKEFPELHDCCILLDEAEIIFDSRRSMSKGNQYKSYFILQTRKRRVVFIYTSQFKGAVDKRLRNIQDLTILCLKDVPEHFHFIISTQSKSVEKLIPKKAFSKIFRLFDTSEIILPEGFEHK